MQVEVNSEERKIQPERFETIDEPQISEIASAEEINDPRKEESFLEYFPEN